MPNFERLNGERLSAGYTALFTPSTPKEETEKNYRADISTLTCMIEAGELRSENNHEFRIP
jgi:hypothetical protein